MLRFPRFSAQLVRCGAPRRAAGVGGVCARHMSDKTLDDTVSPGDSTETGNPAEQGVLAELNKLREKYKAKDTECAKAKDAYVRALADYRNLERNCEIDKRKAKDYALHGFAKDLLDTHDNFDIALASVDKETIENNKDLKGFYEGVLMVHNIFVNALKRNGLEKMDPINKEFNPSEHEAVFQAPQEDKEPGTIFHVERSGYYYKDRVLRAPKVGVVAEKK